MTEPTTATVAALSGVTVTVAGSIFGMQYSLLLIGLFAGLLRLGQVSATSRAAAFSSVTLSAMLAGAVAPVAGSMTASFFNLANTPEELRICAAFLLGYGWQSITPVLVDLIKQKLGGGSQL
jgi:ABC-type multidrug transport system permease subunit